MGRASTGTVNDWIECLGLRTFGKETEDANVVVKRPKFTFPPVLDLYKNEAKKLYTQLATSETLDRDDPQLFDKEFDAVLNKLGPSIWPSKGKRPHLRDPDQKSLYKKHLVYPRDKADIKEYLRRLVLAMKGRNPPVTPNINKSALRGSASKSTKGTATPNPAIRKATPSKSKRRHDEISDDDSVLGDARTLSTRPRVSNQEAPNGQEGPTSHEAHTSQAKGKQKAGYSTGGQTVFEQTKIILFSKPQIAHESINLQGCGSIVELMDRVSKAVRKSALPTGADSSKEGNDPAVSSLKLHLSEDMSSDPWILIENNRSRQAFNRFKTIVMNAPLFPGGHDCVLEAEVVFA